MERPFIERLHIQSYGCIRDLTLNLTPLHALIGPNDSGKSTALMAMRTLTTLAAGPIQNVDDSGRVIGAFWQNDRLSIAGATSSSVGGWTIRRIPQPLQDWYGPPSGSGSNDLDVNSGRRSRASARAPCAGDG